MLVFDVLVLVWHLASEPELPYRTVPARTSFCIFTFGNFLLATRVSLQEGLLRVFELNVTCLWVLKCHFC